MRLSSSRSFNPSQKLTQLVPFFEINSIGFFLVILHLIPYTEVWKWNETAFIWGANSKDFGCLWCEECVSLIDGIGFEKLILNMKTSMLNCQTKKLTDAPFQGFVHMTFKHRPPGKYRKEKKSLYNLLCVGTVWCMWMKAINFWNELWIC